MTTVLTPEQCFSADLIIAQGADFPLLLRYLLTIPGTNVGAVVDTTGYSAQMVVRDGDTNGDVVFSISNLDYITLGWTPGKWTVATSIAQYQQIVPTVYNGYVYQAQNAGTTHASTQPTWPTIVGATVTDNGITWLNMGPALTYLFNIYVNLPAAFTEALEDWGKGVYTLKLLDSFGHTAIFLDGKCHLRTETT